MTVFGMLHKLILGPIELLFDVIFSFSMQMTNSPVLSIIVLSLAINLLVLPLYKKSDAMQREEQEISKRLKPRIDQIREAFTGDERFMMLQTFYRQNNYKPYYVLRGSLSLLLQIPFFMAAYNFLSGLSVLQGVSFGPIPDLAAPDGILKIGGMTVNVLPILMTLINIVSGMIYTRGMPLKSKVQLYGMALVFLALLYNSPAGLVFYWTLNNLFSLGKNILGKLTDSGKILRIGCSAAGLAAGILAALKFRALGTGKTAALIGGAVLLQIPALLRLLRKKRKAGRREKPETGTAGGIFYACCALLTVLTGLLIPSAVIHASPAEFVEPDAFRSPLDFVLHAFLLAAGVFLVWSVVYYLLADREKRPGFAFAFAVLAAAALADYMFFGSGYGNMSSTLVYDTDVAQSVRASEKLLNAGALGLLCAAVWFVRRKKPGILRAACVLACLVTAGMSVVNMVSVGSRIPEIERLANQNRMEEDQIIHLDRKGKNVVVFMLDRAIGYFAPFIFEEKPELKEQFAGFTCYPNTISYGNGTNTGTPALFGGYEYVPEKINARSDVLLKDKQNEALRLMPLNFLENGFEVTVCDPPLANYMWISDLSIYDDHPEIRTFVTAGRAFDDTSFSGSNRNAVRERNLFCYSIFRISPVAAHSVLYDGGNYNKTEAAVSFEDSIFMSEYTVLKNLSNLTRVRDEGRNDFLIMVNSVTHDPISLQEPQYEPADKVDNTAYEQETGARVSADGRKLAVRTLKQQQHYQTNMAAMILLGNWMDSLRQQGVYDNTRIIICADHGTNLGYSGLNVPGTGMNLMEFNPLFLVKDFDAREPFAVSDEFMTHADTPTLAFRGLVENPVNPATGNPVTDGDKQSETQIVGKSHWIVEENNGTVFKDMQYYRLTNRDMRIPENWSAVR